jgi:hypothetical protein
MVIESFKTLLSESMAIPVAAMITLVQTIKVSFSLF